MAFVLNDRVKVSSSDTGTGNLSLGSAIDGFETFAQGIGGSNETYYAIYHLAANEWEVGHGTLDATAANITRTNVLTSSNSDNHVNFTSGTKYIFCTQPASKAVFEDVSNNVDVGNNITVGGTVDGVDIAARDAVLTSTTTTATNANTTANAALPKAGGTMTGDIVFDAGQPKGNSGLVPAAGTSGHFLAHNGAFAQVAYANVSGTPSLATVATSGAYSDLSGTPTVPTNNNQLTNGAGYTTNTGTLTQVTSGGATTVSAGNGIGLNTGNGTITMSGTYSGSFTATGNVTAYSDERIKYNISTIDNALDKVCKLRGVYYTHKQDDEENIGVIAQEVEKVVPELVSIAKTSEKPFEHLDDIRTMKYGNTVGLLIQAVKELKEYVDRSKCDCKCKES